MAEARASILSLPPEVLGRILAKFPDEERSELVAEWSPYAATYRLTACRVMTRVMKTFCLQSLQSDGQLYLPCLLMQKVHVVLSLFGRHPATGDACHF